MLAVLRIAAVKITAAFARAAPPLHIAVFLQLQHRILVAVRAALDPRQRCRGELETRDGGREGGARA